METNDNSVGWAFIGFVAFNILTIAALYALLCVANYAVFAVLLRYAPIDWSEYPTIKQVVDKAHLVLALVTLVLAFIHGFVFILEEYTAPRTSEVNEANSDA